MDNFSIAVITGLSGAGKSTASKAMEDLGYYTIDNMPIPLLNKFVEIILDLEVNTTKIALIIDARIKDADTAYEIIKLLKQKYHAKVLFLESSPDTLINRFKENRRLHPLGAEIPEAIDREVALLKDIKSIADVTVDTTRLSVHELSAQIKEYFQDNADGGLVVNIMSFGFKHGIPIDSDMVFDVRFMKNPYFVTDLRNKTGLDSEVEEYVFAQQESVEFMKKLTDMVFFLIPLYIREGKKYLKISIGCTGGHHRSVAVASILAEKVRQLDNVSVLFKNRDLER